MRTASPNGWSTGETSMTDPAAAGNKQSSTQLAGLAGLWANGQDDCINKKKKKIKV